MNALEMIQKLNEENHKIKFERDEWQKAAQKNLETIYRLRDELQKAHEEIASKETEITKLQAKLYVLMMEREDKEPC